MVQQDYFKKLIADKEVRISIAVALALCLLLSLLALVWDAGAPETGASRLRELVAQPFYAQTFAHVVILTLAVLGMLLGLAHYHVRRDVAVIALISAVYFSGLLELFHLLTVDGVIVGTAPLADVVPLSWVFTRLSKAIILNVVCLAFLLFFRDKPALPPRTVWSYLAIGTLVICVIGFFTVFLLNTTSSVPDTIQQDAFLKRPWDFIAFCFYLLLALLIFPQFYARFPSRTALGVLLSLVLDLFAQLHCAFGADYLYGRHYSFAIIYKAIAYALPICGLILDYHHSHRQGIDAIRRFREAEQKLKNRLLDLQHSSAMHEQEEAERLSAENAIRVLDRAIAASSCGIVITDPHVPGNQIIYVNPSFERITGYPADETIGSGLDFLYGQDRQQPAAQEVVAAVAQARECRVILRNYSRDGRMFWSELDIAPVPDENGMLTHYIGIMTDITDRVRAEDEHRKFTAKLEHTNRELADFVHVASHDLQEPLRKVQVFGDRLRAKCEDSLSSEGLLYLERMQHSVVRMDRLIRDLLTYSRIGRKEQEFTLVDLNAVAHEVLSDLEVRIEETHGQVDVETLPVIEADSTQMRQLLQNLIGNALKFHRPDVAPVVKLSATTITKEIDSHPVPFVEICVADNGIGFDEKYIERIFTVFQRLHTGNRYEGTGLGLTVCRKIAERHGGAIAASSRVGEGSSFFVTLPVNRLFEH